MESENEANHGLLAGWTASVLCVYASSLSFESLAAFEFAHALSMFAAIKVAKTDSNGGLGKGELLETEADANLMHDVS